MFDRIAPRYDLLNRLLSAGIDVRWRRAAVDFLELAGPARVLDLCSGTADLLIEVLGRDARRSGTGVDLSVPMLARGLRKIRDRGMGGRAALVAGDAEALPCADACFDAALVAFGIRNVGVPGDALREVARVLRPGGRLVVLEFSIPGGVLGRAYSVYFSHVLPRIGAMISGHGAAYSYLPASVSRFPGPAEFARLMESSGFEEVRLKKLTGGIAHLYRGTARVAA
jgi:demethylmenaquinone methyltransferase/2-methoxy-6-polyprenyl-1,4-benzoquinol methylase